MLRIRIITSFIFSFIITTGFIFPLSADNDSISFSPPPIPWFEYGTGQTDLRITGTYLSITGDDLEVYGGGSTLIGRYAFSDIVAIDAAAGCYGGGGDVGDLGVGLFMWSVMNDLELQLVRNDKLCLIGFAGLGFGAASISVGTITVDVNTQAIQGGAQASFRIGSVALSPFFIVQSVGGDATVDGGETYTIDSTTVKSFGIDLTLIPYHVTLSSMLQNRPGQNSDVDVVCFTATYNFQWNGVSASETDTPPKSNPDASPKPKPKTKPKKR